MVAFTFIHSVPSVTDSYMIIIMLYDYLALVRLKHHGNLIAVLTRV